MRLSKLPFFISALIVSVIISSSHSSVYAQDFSWNYSLAATEIYTEIDNDTTDNVFTNGEQFDMITFGNDIPNFIGLSDNLQLSDEDTVNARYGVGSSATIDVSQTDPDQYSYEMNVNHSDYAWTCPYDPMDPGCNINPFPYAHSNTYTWMEGELMATETTFLFSYDISYTMDNYSSARIYLNVDGNNFDLLNVSAGNGQQSNTINGSMYIPITIGNITWFHTSLTTSSGTGNGSNVWNTGDITYNYSFSQVPAVVPEPISSTLFIVGGATLGIRQWRKRKSACSN